MEDLPHQEAEGAEPAVGTAGLMGASTRGPPRTSPIITPSPPPPPPSLPRHHHHPVITSSPPTRHCTAPETQFPLPQSPVWLKGRECLACGVSQGLEHAGERQGMWHLYDH